MNAAATPCPPAGADQAPDDLLKRWATLRARACRVGVMLARTDLSDGPVLYFAIHPGAHARQLVDLHAVEAHVADLEGQAT